MTRPTALVTSAALLLGGCTGGTVPAVTPGAATPAGPSLSASAAPVATATPIAMPPVATATATPAEVPPGRILFHRRGSDGVEHYFTINTDGTDEQALYDREGCGCAHWSADWTHVLTLDATGLGTYSFTTMKPDGSDVVTATPRIKTLNLAPGASSADGRWIAFAGWDEEDPSNTGLYVAHPDLANLQLVMPLAEGMKASSHSVSLQMDRASSSSARQGPTAASHMPAIFSSSTPMGAACASSILSEPRPAISACPPSASRLMAARLHSGLMTPSS